MVHTDPATENLVTDKGTIETTPNHPFFTTDRGWVQAGSLKVGEKVRTESGGSATVVSFTVDQHPASMWDLTVDTAHSFFVGSGAVLVHNEGPCDDWTDGSGGWTPPSGYATNKGSIMDLARSNGLDPQRVMKYIEKIAKKTLGPADNVSVSPDGDIFSPSGENMGSIFDAWGGY
jgi:hypothetical protein